MKWLIFTSQLPASPSSLRVMVWRRMKAAGALSLQNGVWVLPHTKAQQQIVQELLSHLHEQGAEGQCFSATALSERVEKDLVQRLRELREEEYAELTEQCKYFLAELGKETRRKKFTFAELEENEDNLQKLEKWHKKIQRRDPVGGKHATEAARSVEACIKAFQAFANHVYAQEQLVSKVHTPREK